MTAVLPHYKPGGPANLQVATLVYGGQFVMPNNATAGTTDLSVKVATSAATTVLGVAATDANVVTTQTPKNASATITPAYNNVVARCTNPGGVSSAMLTQQIGGQGSAVYYLGRARVL